MPEQSLSSTGMVSVRCTMVFLHLGILGGTSALYLGAIFNSKITKKKLRNVADMALCRPWKGRLFAV